MKFKTKPIEVDAMQWDGTYESALAIREAFGRDVKPVPFETRCHLSIITADEFANLEPWDWVVRHESGSLALVKKEAFENNYEPFANTPHP